jgi:hypothetical protein
VREAADYGRWSEGSEEAFEREEGGDGSDVNGMMR